MITLVNEIRHVPVLLNETVALLDPKPGEVFVDCTVGTGGHAVEIGRRILPDGTLIIIDRDDEAISVALANLGTLPILVRPFVSNFSSALQELRDEGVKVDGVLFDLGFSSFQLEEVERGFSYIHPGPLDMRMDRDQEFTAFDVVNKYSEKELIRVFKEYGEERWSTRIAAAICERRRGKAIENGSGLVEIIDAAIPFKARTGHPAKRVFQAIRIEVNDEIGELKRALEIITEIVEKGARIAVISFHSLEDRVVKKFFKGLSECICPKGLPECKCEPKLRVLTPKAVKPHQSEISSNPRAKSAVLRVAAVI